MFEFAWPWVLLLILLPPLVWFSVKKASLHLPVALTVPFYQDLAFIMTSGKRIPHMSSIRLFFLIWTLIVIALAGPRWIGYPLPLAQEGRNIMMALDLSGSMEIDDMVFHNQPVSRLEVVKQTAEQFVRNRKYDRLGLILFGSQAYLQTPLTFDRKNILERLDDATVGLAGKTTSIGDAIGLAIKRLLDVSAKSRVIILLTDGVNNSGFLSPVKAAELAKAEHIKIYTIGLGGEVDPGRINPFLNLSMGAELDEKTLQEVAKMTGGLYFRATDAASLEAIYNTIDRLETVTQEDQTIRPQRDYYFWPLAAALVLFLGWFYRKAKPC